MKRLTVLGSTGSIGRNCLQVIAAHPDDFSVVGLSCHQQVALLYDQCLQLKPKVVCITGQNIPLEFFDKFEALGITVLTGKEGLIDLASFTDVDLLINCLVGANGLLPTLASISSNVAIALANKESLVMAGEIITELASEKGVVILPIDSEHSAIFQCLQGEDRATVERLILTASGGPFHRFTLEQLEQVTVQQALAHPNWSMGQKVSIDAATMMNKGLEVIASHWLFQVPVSHIEVVIHPESIVHSMVEFVDGTIKAQLGMQDMKMAIQYALTFPQRRYLQTERIDFSLLQKLSFELPNFRQFPACALAYEAIKIGGTAPAVLNAANEEAVQYFLKGQIRFNQISRFVEQTLAHHQPQPRPQLNDILAADLWARNYVRELIQQETVLVVAF
ncbi:MAG: 1-deoxy-D-xylulose-5-phosphate reductoisomerase [candidate division KSB1 bacterium]|nr:1-deoxy-D-xylulose-5-phosphate reductoisomerase [candidate division KSB1 bacterium]MDZ7317991.1 1-deoxy-D-xylulose-5-phosphate reductoisomerase [candidate division KSB1 bacterium]MDZ7340652.1 1-deoxy-D-xylulose-5-phosphate reductoisomerase [candidate division KSB1 bacterium]